MNARYPVSARNTFDYRAKLIPIYLVSYVIYKAKEH